MRDSLEQFCDVLSYNVNLDEWLAAEDAVRKYIESQKEGPI